MDDEEKEIVDVIITTAQQQLLQCLAIVVWLPYTQVLCVEEKQWR